jgi:hypothetical protein
MERFDVTNQLSVPKGFNHGAAIAVEPILIDTLSKLP